MSGRLKSARMTNATLVSSVDNRGSDLEVALSEIFGLPLDSDVTSIFGDVDSDGAVRKLEINNTSGSASNSGGLRLREEARSDDYLMTMLNGKIQFYKRVGGSSSVERVSILDKAIDSVYGLFQFSDLTEGANGSKYLRFSSDGYKIEAGTPDVTPSLVLGDLLDCPAENGSEGTVLMSNGPGLQTYWGTGTEGTSQIRQLLDVVDYSDVPGEPYIYNNHMVQVRNNGSDYEGYIGYSRIPYQHAFLNNDVISTSRSFIPHADEGVGEVLIWHGDGSDLPDDDEANIHSLKRDFLMPGSDDYDRFVYMLQLNVEIAEFNLIGRALEFRVYTDDNEVQKQFCAVPFLNSIPPFTIGGGTDDTVQCHFTMNFLIPVIKSDLGAAKTGYVFMYWHTGHTRIEDPNNPGTYIHVSSGYSKPFIDSIDATLTRVS